MNRTRLNFNDVSLTDGQTAVWSGTMDTAMMVSVAKHFNGSRLSALEVMSRATMVQCLGRGEDPWQRIEVLRNEIDSVPLRASINLLTDHGVRGLDVLPEGTVKMWISLLANLGIDKLVVIDPFVKTRRLESAIAAVHKMGKIPIGVVPFTEDEVLPDEYFTDLGAHLVQVGAKEVMLRDESGVLTPSRLATLLPQLKDVLGQTPLILHTRCTTALGPQVACEAIKLGVDQMDTALPALANGASLPSSMMLVDALDALHINTEKPDLSVLVNANAELVDIQEQENYEPALPWVFDLAPFAHQLPGDIAAWAMKLLHVEGQWHLLHAFANECTRIRGEIGSPPMMMPFAKGIAEQALINLEEIKRYTEIRPIVRRTLQGAYGKTRAAVDVGLLKWIGAVEPALPLSWAELCSETPEATDEQRVLYHTCALEPKNQPKPETLDNLVYQKIAPQEMLQNYLKGFSDKYSFISVTGPDVDVQFSSTGDGK